MFRRQALDFVLLILIENHIPVLDFGCQVEKEVSRFSCEFVCVHIICLSMVLSTVHREIYARSKGHAVFENPDADEQHDSS